MTKVHRAGGDKCRGEDENRGLESGEEAGEGVRHQNIPGRGNSREPSVAVANLGTEKEEVKPRDAGRGQWCGPYQLARTLTFPSSGRGQLGKFLSGGDTQSDLGV